MVAAWVPAVDRTRERAVSRRWVLVLGLTVAVALVLALVLGAVVAFALRA